MNKALYTELCEIISDVRTKGFEYSDTSEVPSANVPDPNLTYESGETKKGKKIKTCVLFVDIRNSVKLIEDHQFDTMGKVYTAFTKSVLKIAEYHGGKVRNIIGDRVMIVFPSDECFTNAVDCAISINHVALEINTTFDHVDFKCGIGIDYGEMRIIKVGIEKKGGENSDYKNLIWVGYPANKASRLTDVANKEIEETFFEVVRETNVFYRDPVRHVPKREIIEMSAEDFADIFINGDEKMIYVRNLKDILRFEKKKRTIVIPPILITEAVYNGYKKANHYCNTISEGQWKEVDSKIKNITEKIFGAITTWKLE